MKTTFCTSLVGLYLGIAVYGQGFVNLDFEQAVVQPQDPEYGFLEWALAVPGWAHSAASDTQYVYYRNLHLGTTPAFLLSDSQSPVWNPGSLEGDYSLYFLNGAVDGQWLQTFISQSGLIPAEALSIRLLSIGSFQVFINDVEVPLIPFGGNAYGGNVSNFAGTIAQLKIVNSSKSFQEPYYLGIVDGITFSPEAVPEPSSLALLGFGGFFFAACLLRVVGSVESALTGRGLEGLTVRSGAASPSLKISSDERCTTRKQRRTRS